MRHKKKRDLVILSLTVLILLASIFGPEQMARYKDRGMMNEISVEAVDSSGSGYRYTLNSNEKLWLLSECLNQIGRAHV